MISLPISQTFPIFAINQQTPMNAIFPNLRISHVTATFMPKWYTYIKTKRSFVYGPYLAFLRQIWGHTDTRFVRSDRYGHLIEYKSGATRNENRLLRTTPGPGMESNEHTHYMNRKVMSHPTKGKEHAKETIIRFLSLSEHVKHCTSTQRVLVHEHADKKGIN